MLTNYGEEYFLKVAITEQKSVPANFQVGLSQSDEATLGESVTLAGINEVVGSGYSRINVASDAVDWTPGLDNDDWMAASKLLIFTATGTWTIAKSAFITDGTGVIAVRDLLQPQTLTSGKSITALFKLKQS